ncbi:MAG: hypothetical protein LQ337_007801 [Flavoplaca oasis]|nr:MAG: hypothetical protein LQ337_007801 [Flavoplaca oasis]
MASPVLTAPNSPSVFDQDPRSPNSWTARSFTTLLPSDSPSQALFPKHSQASLVLAARTDYARTIRPPQIPPLAIQHNGQPTFIKRNLDFILSAAVLHSSLIVLTILLVLIITAATGKPPKRINPSYYLGILLSVAAGLASVIFIYIKYNERRRSSSTGVLQSPISQLYNDNNIELGRIAPPQTTVRDAVSNWDNQDLQSRNPLDAFMVSRIPLTTASARIAGSNNRPRGVEEVDLNPELTPYTQRHHRQHDSTSTAAALQRFLDNELQRQEKIKRRISAWLRGVSAPTPPVESSAPKYPPPPIPSTLPRPPQRKRTADLARLAELDKEIESYLGFAPPPLVIGQSKAEYDRKAEKSIGNKDGEDDEEIDYDTLPPAVPRQGATGRRPMLSDPITVLHVGPMRQKGSPLVKEVEGSDGGGTTTNTPHSRSTPIISAPTPTATPTLTSTPAPNLPFSPPNSHKSKGCGGVQAGLRGGEDRDSLVDKWLKKMVRGVDVERWLGPAVQRDRRSRWGRFW